MGKILVFDQPRHVVFEEYEERALEPGEVRLQTLYSGISAGTQLTAYRGTNPFASKEWNSDLRIFERAAGRHGFYPVKGAWGYEEVGKVVETGSRVEDVKVGEVIYGTWGHRSTHIVEEQFAIHHRLPEKVDPITGIYSQMGCIALNAVLDADIHVGETVAVFGQGVPGQIVTQLARLNGAAVIAVDLDDYRLKHSRKSGADHVLQGRSCDAAKEIKELTAGKGADICIEISGSAAALHEAIRAAAYNGRVVCSGFFQGEAKGLYLGEEFHHNRVNIVCSQINAVAPALSGRWDRLRMEKTVFGLQQKGKIDLKSLITHVVPFSEGGRAYGMLDEGTEKCLQVVLRFD